MKSHTYRDMYELENTHFWFLGKQAFIHSALNHLNVKNARILDIGCGTGGTTAFLTRWGKVTGLEQNKTAASFASKRGVHVVHGSANHLPFKNKSFDLVTIFDVLYHKGVVESQVLQEAFRVLKPGGTLLITDCALPWLTSNHDAIMDAKYRYTKKQLQNITISAGFRIYTTQYIYSSVFLPFALSRLLMRNVKPTIHLPTVPHVVNSIFKKLLNLEASFFPKLNPPIGSSIILLAHKI